VRAERRSFADGASAVRTRRGWQSPRILRRHHIPGKQYIDWNLADPAGRPTAEVRAIRDEIDLRVRQLLADLPANPHP
jgi:hypothetical protein